jgi:hypothetical protein
MPHILKSSIHLNLNWFFKIVYTHLTLQELIFIIWKPVVALYETV